jgi:hypothetical protein
MRRTKVYAPTRAAPAVKPEARGAVVYRAAAGPAPKPAARPAPAPAVARAEVNHSPDYAAAALVPVGRPAAAGWVALVPPGGSLAAPPGTELRAFLHRDGSAVKFAGAAGAVHLEPPQVEAEFGPLLPDARRLLAAHPLAAAPAKPPVHRAAESGAAPAADAAAAVVRASATGGSPLPVAARSKLESSFGTDLGAVRVHTDTAADAAARSVQAHAFAHGTDVYFRAGQYRPGTPSGEKLLAHEVAHTVQQAGGTGHVARHADPAGLTVTAPGDRVEREAEAAAEKAVRGEPAALHSAGGAAARLAEKPAPKAAPAPPAKKDAAPPGKPAAKPAAAPPADAAKAKGRELTGKKAKEPAKKPGTPQAGAEKAAPEPAAAGGGLQEVIAGVAAAGREQKQHDPAEKAATDSEKAADVTPDQAAGHGKGEQLQAMASQKKKPFDRENFKKALREKIQALQPNDAKSIKDGDKAGGINAAVKAGVADGKQAAAGDIDRAAKQQPPVGEPKKGADLSPPQPGQPPQVDGAKAVPPPAPEARVSMAGESRAIDEQMAAANVSPQQLQAANEPTFQAAAAARTTAQAQADALPGKARGAERQTLDKSRAEAAAVTQTGLAGMHGRRTELLAAGHARQADGKAQFEATRKKVTDELTQIYADTKKAVDDRLAALDRQVADTFDQGASAAKTDFYLFIGGELIAYALRKGLILGLIGALTKDQEYVAIFDRGRSKYLADMEGVIDQVATVVETGLNEVVNVLAAGKGELEAALAKLGPDEQAVGREVADGLRGQFADLEQSVEAKQQELVDSVAQKYVAAQQEVNGAIGVLRDPVGAVIDFARESVAGVLDTILKMKQLLATTLAKAGEAIDLILAGPVAFLGHLVAGVKQGVLNFAANIGKHLQKGLLDWLFGALAQAGIQMPEKFDLGGLLSVVLQVLGLTWANIRKRAVAILGENVVKALETASEIFVVLATKGPAGLWEYVKEQAAALLETLKEGVKSFVIESVVVAGVKWLIGLLNPASAFVKACLAIYDIVTFIINRGQQILALVNAVLDSVLSIARGAIAPAAAAVEAALARAVPVAIGFLAGLLGIGDLGEKLKKVIEKIQAPINKAIDWLIKKAVALVKTIGKALGGGGKEEKRAEVALPPVEVDTRTSMDGESHTLRAQVAGGQMTFTIESTPESLLTVATQAITEVEQSSRSPEDKKWIIIELRQIISHLDPKKIETSLRAGRKEEVPDNVVAKYIKDKLVRAGSDLLALGNKYKVRSIRELFKTITPVQRYLPESYNVRDKLYQRVGGYNEKLAAFAGSAIASVKAKLRVIISAGDQTSWAAHKAEPEPIVHPKADMAHFNPELIRRGKGGGIYDYQVDHIQPLAQHWVGVGHNSNDASRVEAATGLTNMRLITQFANASKGSEDVQFINWVGTEFSSTAASCPQNARAIDGKPFTDKNREEI